MKWNLLVLTALTLSSCQINNKPKVIPESINYFDFENLSSEAKSEFSEEYWLGSGEIKEINYKNEGVIIGMEDDQLYKNLVVTENNIVVSYSYGNNSKTIVYNKKQAKLIQISFSMFVRDLLKNDVLSVEKDYFDSLDVQDPNYRGHIFEKGTYDLKSGKYSFVSHL
jgi:hypothetical protein